jgi:hypothetical protein
MTSKKKKDKRKAKKKPKKEVKETKDSVLFLSLFFILVVFLAGLFTIKYLPEIKKFFIKEKTEPVIQDTIEYNGFIFEKIGSTWYGNIVVDWSGKKIPYNLQFYYSPKEVENISIDENAGVVLKLRGDHTVYISLNPHLNTRAVIAGTEISKILGKVFFIKVKSGMTKPVENAKFPVITCENISNKTKVVIMDVGNETKITLNKTGCIHVYGTDEQELIKAADRLAYNLLDIDKKKT